MEIYWTSRKAINGLKHFVLINQYEFKKKVFEESSQWIKGWNDNERENIDMKEYLEFKSSRKEYKTNKIIFNQTSLFNIS